MITPQRVSDLEDTVGYTNEELRDLRKFYKFLVDVGRELDYGLLESESRRNLDAVNSIISNRDMM